jgi:DNA-binding NtrC family response regulator
MKVVGEEGLRGHTMDMILVVEDQEMDTRLLQVAMKYFADSRGARVKYCRRSAEAIEAMRNGAYSLIIMDLNLCDPVSGEALLSRPEFRKTPVIVISGREEFYLRGLKIQFKNIITYFRKPFNLTALRDTIEDFLNSPERGTPLDGANHNGANPNGGNRKEGQINGGLLNGGPATHGQLGSPAF